MQVPFIGREKEKQLLKEAFESPEAEMVAVIGRRRVGKTFLVETAFEGKITFKITGIQNASRREQLLNFVGRLKAHDPGLLLLKPPDTWLEAFFFLIQFLEKKENPDERMVVFFDELPWLASRRSGFLKGLSYFWNSWAVQKNVVVVVCGSAASWMIQKILRNKGSLYNRVTKRIFLKPFNLSETTRYLKSRHLFFDPYQTVQLYMAMGGIPHYLKEIKNGRSAVQNIDQVCFSEAGLLRDEFLSLYLALFEHAEKHVAVIRALAKKWLGMTRQEIVRAIGASEGGRTTTVLGELEQSGFISSYHPFGKRKKDKLFRLTDEYSLFYLTFIENNQREGEGTWEALSQTQAYKSWSGYAFENICLKHVPEIKKALGIGRVYSLTSSFFQKGTATEPGTQIDLLIDRNDHVINLFEIKFYNAAFSLTKQQADQLRKKRQVFQSAIKTKKQIFISFLSTFGLVPNQHSLGLVVDNLDMEALFD